MPDTETLFRLLAADRRRQVLLLLCGTESLSVPEGLVERGARTEQPGAGLSPPARGETGEFRPELQQRLHHVDLPKLEAADLIEWDREAGVVSRGPGYGEVEPVLRLIADNADRFPDDLF
jgi:hypothetical protein